MKERMETQKYNKYHTYYALILTNKSAIDLRNWKERRFENTLISNRDLR